MRHNPEFQRNLWMEITPHRIYATPLILGSFYYLILFWSDAGEQALMMISLWVFIFVSGFWGTYQAESTLVTEIQNKTWPLQRLTSISPWEMTWGKLFGSTLFSWYIGLWSLLVAMLTYGLVPENYLFTNPGRKWILFSHGVGPALLYIVGIVIVFQAWGFLVGMWQLQSKLAKEKRKSGMSLPFAIFVLPSMFIATFEPVEWAKNMHWYHWEFDPMWFWLSSLYFLLGWIITGIYMQMRKELQVSNSPWIWLVFLLTVVGYAMGFLQEDQASILTGLHLWTKRLMLGLGILIGINYGFMTWVRSDGMDMRRLLYLWNLRRIRDTLSEMPRWVFTTLLAWMSAIGVMIAHLVLGGGFLSSEGDPLNLYGLILAGMCFMTRDLAMILYFYFSSKPQRAVGTAILYWTVLYWLIPLLLGVVWMDDLNPFFLPDPKVHIAYAILPPLVEALVMCRFTLRRWRARFGEPVTAPPPAEPGPIPVNA